METTRIPTSYDVWKTIKIWHPELKVFESYSAPGGDYFGDPGICIMYTSYGFPGTDYPIMAAETIWHRSPGSPDEIVKAANRAAEQTKYWLCVAIPNID